MAEDDGKFDTLLAWLHSDRNQAATRYEEIRRGLIRIFMHRGCPIAEDLADETIERVTQKVNKVRKIYNPDDNPARYFFRVAHFIHREYLKRRLEPVPPPPIEKDDIENELDCLDRCLDRLAPEDRELILAYYPSEGKNLEARKTLATNTGLGLNVLRIRTHRIRTRLETCIRECLKLKLV